MSSRSESLRRRLLSCAAAAVTLSLAGCAQNQAGKTQQDSLPGGVTARDPNNPLIRPGGVSQSSHVRTALLLLGSIPYDNLSLPLVSPSGEFIATQAGFPPTWPTLRAEANAEPPIDTRVQMYLLNYAMRTPSSVSDPRDLHSPPTLIADVKEPALLGRACNDDGFLIESPRTDGSRWIGLADWTSGKVDWLVADSNVNAFATLNAAGDLAWCRRTPGGANFEVVVRRAGGGEMVLATPGDDWLMPAWAQNPDRLFAFHLSGGELTATYHSLQSESSLNRPLYLLPIAVDAKVDTAYQSMTPHPYSTAASLASSDQLVFFHPVRAQTAVWRPLENGAQQLIIVPGGSITALVDQSRYALVTTERHLVRQNLLVPSQRQEIIAGLLVARPTSNPEWPYVLMSPSRPGQIGLTALNLLPVSGR